MARTSFPPRRKVRRQLLIFCEGPAENARGVLFPLPAIGVVCNPPLITLLPRSLPLPAEPG